MPEFVTRPVTEADIEIWHEMRCQLWPDHSAHAYDLQHYFTNQKESQIAYLAIPVNSPDTPVGFIELSLRQDTISGGDVPAAYIEGWFVSEFMRHAGAGKALMATAEEWSRKRGCRALTSECRIDNKPSASAHHACGFHETRRTLSFRKEI